MVDPPFGSSGFRTERMVALDDDPAEEFLIRDF
jgi:hypothetical protein